MSSVGRGPPKRLNRPAKWANGAAPENAGSLPGHLPVCASAVSILGSGYLAAVGSAASGAPVTLWQGKLREEGLLCPRDYKTGVHHGGQMWLLGHLFLWSSWKVLFTSWLCMKGSSLRKDTSE